MLSSKNTILSLGLAAGSTMVAFAVPYEESYLDLVDECANQARDPLRVWEHDICVIAAVGHNTPLQPVKFFLHDVFGEEGAPDAVEVERVSEEVLARLAYGQVGADITSQSWVDAFYGALSEVGGPYPDDVNVVAFQYSSVRCWTDVDGDVPPSKLAAYLQYSSSEQGGVGCPRVLDVNITTPAVALPSGTASA